MTSTSIPTTMRAAVQHAFGDPTTLAIEEVTVPRPAAGEVLLRTLAATINPVDWKTRRGQGVVQDIPEGGLILGWDIAGEVVAVGDEVTAFAVGDRVFGLIRFPAAGRAHATYATAPVDQVVRIPDNVAVADAGVIPLVGLTAWQALHDAAGIQAGQRVLIHAGSGGVGHIAVQLAKQAGAYVLTTASAANRDRVLALGADEVIDYRTQRFEEIARDIDVVFNTVGEEIVARSWQTLRPGGVLVSIAGVPKEAPEGMTGASVFVHPDGAQMQQLAELMSTGALKPVIQQTFTLDEIQALHRTSEAGHGVGKLALAF